MAQLSPYLSFNGNCREAMTFYQECLGGELHMQTVGDSPMAEKMPAEKKNNIMHSTLTAGDIVLMAADSMDHEPWVAGNAMTLCINCGSEEEITTFFNKLSVGGKVIHPLTVEFWGATFGMLTDKFGIQWMFNFEKKSQA